MKPGASAGRMPANVSESERASVTAGLANDVDAVNQYAAVMYRPDDDRHGSSRCGAPTDHQHEPERGHSFTHELSDTRSRAQRTKPPAAQT
jgi:hypothetical protein